MTSPSICIFDGDSHYIYCIGGTKKQTGDYSWPKMDITIEYPDKDYKNNIERYSNISGKFLDFIRIICGDDSHVKVFIEGYAFGSSGSRVFNIAEHTQTLKLRLYNAYGIELMEPIPPTTAKKFATGVGNCSKDDMCNKFVEETGIEIIDKIPAKLYTNPVNDIIDSYWICENGRHIDGK